MAAERSVLRRFHGRFRIFAYFRSPWHGTRHRSGHFAQFGILFKSSMWRSILPTWVSSVMSKVNYRILLCIVHTHVLVLIPVCNAHPYFSLEKFGQKSARCTPVPGVSVCPWPVLGVCILSLDSCVSRALACGLFWRKFKSQLYCLLRPRPWLSGLTELSSPYTENGTPGADMVGS